MKNKFTKNQKELMKDIINQQDIGETVLVTEKYIMTIIIQQNNKLDKLINNDNPFYLKLKRLPTNENKK